jgi:hypothetical protein
LGGEKKKRKTTEVEKVGRRRGEKLIVNAGKVQLYTLRSSSLLRNRLNRINTRNSQTAVRGKRRMSEAQKRGNWRAKSERKAEIVYE